MSIARNAEQNYYKILVPPQLKDNGAPTSLTYLDVKGYSHLRVLIQIGVTDIAVTAAPALYHCDTSGGTYAAITSAELGDAISATEDSKIFALDVDLTRGDIKRYVKCMITAGNGTTGTNLAVLGILSGKHSGQHDGGITDAGLTELVAV